MFNQTNKLIAQLFTEMKCSFNYNRSWCADLFIKQKMTSSGFFRDSL